MILADEEAAMKYSVKELLVLHLFVFVVSEAKESNELRAPNVRAINFGKTVTNAVLNAGVFLRVRAMSDEDCAFNCDGMELYLVQLSFILTTLRQ